MRIARLEFFDMHKLVEIGDSAMYYELVLPTQPSIGNVIPKVNEKVLDEIKYGKLIFRVAGNDRFGYFDGEPTIKLIFSHFEVQK